MLDFLFQSDTSDQDWDNVMLQQIDADKLGTIAEKILSQRRGQTGDGVEEGGQADEVDADNLGSSSDGLKMADDAVISFAVYL